VLGTEFEAIPEGMQQESRLLMREIFEWLVETLSLGREQGSLHFIGDPRHKAVCIGSALQGSLQIARMAGRERFHQILGQMALELTAASGDSLP
jgi:TetR/AcrR family transcriptional repressor of nem operon